MEGECGLEAGEEHPRDQLGSSLRGAGGEGSLHAWAWRPPGAAVSRDLPELCPRAHRGDAVGDRGVLALTGLFSGFRGALG